MQKSQWFFFWKNVFWKGALKLCKPLKEAKKEPNTNLNYQLPLNSLFLSHYEVFIHDWGCKVSQQHQELITTEQWWEQWFLSSLALVAKIPKTKFPKDSFIPLTATLVPFPLGFGVHMPWPWKKNEHTEWMSISTAWFFCSWLKKDSVFTSIHHYCKWGKEVSRGRCP